MWTFPALISLRDWSCNDEMPCCFNTSREIPLRGRMGGGERKSGPDRKRREMKGVGVEGVAWREREGRDKRESREEKFYFYKFWCLKLVSIELVLCSAVLIRRFRENSSTANSLFKCKCLRFVGNECKNLGQVQDAPASRASGANVNVSAQDDQNPVHIHPDSEIPNRSIRIRKIISHFHFSFLSTAFQRLWQGTLA